eukprot:1858041-Rhodomonas_salina.1
MVSAYHKTPREYHAMVSAYVRLRHHFVPPYPASVPPDSIRQRHIQMLSPHFLRQTCSHRSRAVKVKSLLPSLGHEHSESRSRALALLRALPELGYLVRHRARGAIACARVQLYDSCRSHKGLCANLRAKRAIRGWWRGGGERRAQGRGGEEREKGREREGED